MTEKFTLLKKPIPAEMNYEDFKTVYVEKTLSASEWKQIKKNLIPASDVYISLLAKRFNLPYTIGKKDADRFYADNQAPIYPPNEGAVGEIETVDIEKDSIVLTIYGRELGSYVSPEGTSFEDRSLPRETITDLSNYHRYRVLKTIKGAEKGVIAAWFGRFGGGIQYKLPVSIVRLLGEFLEELYDAD